MLDYDYDFRQPVSIDAAPAGKICEWCGKPAVHQLTAQGGMRHNESGFFCAQCSAIFVRTVASSLSREVTVDGEVAPG